MGRHTSAILMAAGLAVLLGGCGDHGRKTATAATVASTPTAASNTAVAIPAGRIVFRRYTDPAHNNAALFTARTDGNLDQQLTHPPDDFVDDHPDFSPNGRQIAFERCQEGDGGGDAALSGFEPCSVWTVPTDGGVPRQIRVRCQLDPCDARSPAWVPDGKLVLTVDQGPVKVLGGDFSQLKESSVDEIDPATGQQRTVYERGGWQGEAAYPAVSPDGRTLLYSRRNSPRATPPRDNSLFAVGMDGEGDHQVTPWKLGGGDHASFSSDGDVLFRSYEDDETPQSQIFTVRPDGKHLHQITHFPDGTLLGSSSASPDGKWIVIANKLDSAADDSDISIIAAAGGQAQPIISTKDWEGSPDWAPK